ncbi:hypothetical protein ABVF61_05225 [Roseibium sp. HPY-6]|uniref:hypothetical protein n=1 Tax=Roseibium sp. HPY-6 TaxID=3229852 RepID=UPI00338E6E87
MARLQKFSGSQTLPGVGTPQVIADTAVGSATATLGTQISRSAKDIEDLSAVANRFHAERKDTLERDEAKARSDDLTLRSEIYSAKKAAERHQYDVLMRLPSAQDSADPARPESAQISEALLEFMSDNKSRVFADLPEAQKEIFDAETARGEEQLRYGIAATEADLSKSNYLNGVRESVERASDLVGQFPDSIDEALEQHRNLVEITPLPRGLKRQALRDGQEKLLENWISSLPLNDQIEGLTRLVERGGGSGEPGYDEDAGTRSANRGASQFMERAYQLSSQSRNRLLADALRKKAQKSSLEAQTLVERMSSAEEPFDPEEITRSANLDTHTKLQLLNEYRAALDDRSGKLSAIEWSLSSEPGDGLGHNDQAKADLAYSHLVSGEDDPGTLALGVLRTKGILPRRFENALVRNLQSPHSNEVVRAVEFLSAFERSGSGPAVPADAGDRLRAATLKSNVLQSRFGLEPVETAELLARSNQRQTRDERQVDFGKRYARQIRETTSHNPATDRLIASTFGKV